MLKIQFTVHKHVNYGEAVFISGNLPNLGFWNPYQSIRLNWSQGHYWTTTLEIKKDQMLRYSFLEYKYFIGKWQNPLEGQIKWQEGSINRKISLYMLENEEHINDDWNQRKVKIHLITKKPIFHNLSMNYRYSIIGNCPELGNCIANRGNWKIRKILKIQDYLDFKTIRKLSENISRKDIQRFLKNQLFFQVYATVVHLPLSLEKFSYYFIRENQKLEIQRHPGRSFNLLQSLNYPHRYAVIFQPQKIKIYDEQNFDKPTLSKITSQIFIGSYLKNQNDLLQLKNLGIQAIYSIQTEQDHNDHGISIFYLELLCRQYGIQFKTISIEGKNPKDFVEKSLKSVTEIDELIRLGKKTYIYCSAGKYRSPQMVVLYLTLKNGINVGQAVRLIKEKHPIARPNQRIIKNAVYHIHKYKKRLFDFQSSFQTINN